MGAVRKKGKNHCLLRSAHNRTRGKYIRQRARTTANKRKRIARQTEIRKVKLANKKIA